MRIVRVGSVKNLGKGKKRKLVPITSSLCSFRSGKKLASMTDDKYIAKIQRAKIKKPLKSSSN